jgi:hypothetical protein
MEKTFSFGAWERVMSKTWKMFSQAGAWERVMSETG